jgi:hypothetical protein
MAKLADLQLATGTLKPFTFKHTEKNGNVVDVKVLIRVLTKAELDLARANALSTVQHLSKELREGRTYDQMLAEARTIEILASACMDPEKPTEQWAPQMVIAQTLHPGAIALLERAYEEHQDDCGPFVRDLTSEQYDAIVEEVAREASADPLALFAWPLRNACIITMARELRALRTEKSSRSSESNSPSTDGGSPAEAEEVTRGVNDALGDVYAEMAVMRDQYASMVVRLTRVEADQMVSVVER